MSGTIEARVGLEPPSPAVREIAGRITKLTYRDTVYLAVILRKALENEQRPGSASVILGIVPALLATCDIIEKEGKGDVEWVATGGTRGGSSNRG